MDDAFCGGGDLNEGLSSTAIPISAAAVNMIKAAIFMGDPRYVYNLVPYQVGTCRASGVRPPHPQPAPTHIADAYYNISCSQFAPRAAGFVCPSAAKIQSYCDAADPYCCNGNDANTHQGYGTEYGQAALTFINAKLSATGSSSAPAGPTTTAPSTTPTQPTGGAGVSQKYGQCGGIGWTGPTACAAGSTCQAANAYYSQCL